MPSSIIAVVILTVLSGFADAQGFLHASRIWERGSFDADAAVKSGAAFATAIGLYWGALWYLRALGIVSPELQTLIWFAATIVGVSLLSGELLHWRPSDQLVAVAVLFGIGFLMVRTAV